MHNLTKVGYNNINDLHNHKLTIALSYYPSLVTDGKLATP